ncbi:MAG: iron ABC transporter permease [Candidatus Omnitrophica bacterium]|nr:iron ABC transporter permease [Candidatus Omnitrophota bacterium]MDD5236937.1 iron ABC transporter permease [Candidatus Omnitrophota bacterium]MDD5610266.1 iron ABC transporter permease [Candidatus Omnitrophota bacterium]
MFAHLKKRLVVLFLLLCLVVVLALIKGAVNIPLQSLLLKDNRVILNMRILRIITAILAGSGLAVSGITLQAILRNPLAEPYLLGTSSGAGLAAIIALVLGVSINYMPLAAFLGAVASIVLVYALAREENRISDKSLILSGVIISVAFSSLIVFLISISGNRAIHEMTWWLWGSFQVYDYKLVLAVAFPVVLGIAAIYLFAQDLNAISLGEEEAMHLGIDTQGIKKILILITALITASLICICGIIGFVGLIVPHMIRLIVGPNHKVLIPISCLAASIFMIGSDLLARTLFAPLEIPIGVITAIIGAPVFILLLKRGMRLR